MAENRVSPQSWRRRPLPRKAPSAPANEVTQLAKFRVGPGVVRTPAVAKPPPVPARRRVIRRVERRGIFLYVAAGLGLAVALYAIRVTESFMRESAAANTAAAELATADLVERYFDLDRKIGQWEEQNGLDRVRAPFEGELAELGTILDGIHVPEDVKVLYQRRGVVLGALAELAARYESPSAIRALAGTLETPFLPAGRLSPIRGVDLQSLSCRFGGQRAPCDTVLRGDPITLTSELLGRSLRFAVPVSLRAGPEGLVFDVTLPNERGDSQRVVEAGVWTGYSHQVRMAGNRNTLEIVDAELVPVVQIHFDPRKRLVVIGGRFHADTGDVIAAFPNELVSRAVRFSGSMATGEFQALEFYSRGETDVEAKLLDLPTWFYYSGGRPMLKHDAFAAAGFQ